jgi:hypothetical protein
MNIFSELLGSHPIEDQRLFDVRVKKKEEADRTDVSRSYLGARGKKLATDMAREKNGGRGERREGREI